MAVYGMLTNKDHGSFCLKNLVTQTKHNRLQILKKPQTRYCSNRVCSLQIWKKKTSQRGKEAKTVW